MIRTGGLPGLLIAVFAPHKAYTNLKLGNSFGEFVRIMSSAKNVTSDNDVIVLMLHGNYAGGNVLWKPNNIAMVCDNISCIVLFLNLGLNNSILLYEKQMKQEFCWTETIYLILTLSFHCYIWEMKKY